MKRMACLQSSISIGSNLFVYLFVYPICLSICLPCTGSIWKSKQLIGKANNAHKNYFTGNEKLGKLFPVIAVPCVVVLLSLSILIHKRYGKLFTSYARVRACVCMCVCVCVCVVSVGP